MKRPKTIHLWRTNLQWKRLCEGQTVITVDIPSLDIYLRNERSKK